jgi:hypothetical protein
MTPAELWTLELDKAAAGRKPTGRPAGLWGRLAVWRAVLLGVPAWLVTAALVARDPSDPPPGEGWAALHGEIANRTTPLLDLLIAQAPETPILLLGRPHRGLAAVAGLFAARGLPAPRLFRPWRFDDALATLRELRDVLTAGFHLAAARPRPLPPTREMAAIVYRLAQGLASRRWALRQGGIGTVVFGHTGLADTSLLELGLQAAGARTVHWVHGVSQGWNFTGLSTRAVFQSESDARWHRGLGGYGTTTALKARPAKPLREGEGWLLLSNRAHPMDPDYQARGLRAEINLLRGVARAADMAGQPRVGVTWKPHPVLYSLPAIVQTSALAEARRLGFTLWDPDNRDLAGARAFAFIITSPSTAAIDMLRLGKLPVIFGPPGDPACAVAQIPTRTKDAPALAALAAELTDPARWRARYDAAWKAVGPGRKPDWADLIKP